jgi:Tol biopolymer transport system component/DNA-binding winged helix-turn-helix (wHTH) protein
MFRPGPPADERALPERFRFAANEGAALEVDVPVRRLHRGGEVVPLEPRAFDLLLLLAANPRRVVGKEEIFERLWDGAFVTDNALTRVIAQLRQLLGDRAESPWLIETLRTRGYRFLPAIEAIDEPPLAVPTDPAGAAAPVAIPALDPPSLAPGIGPPRETAGAGNREWTVAGSRLRRLGPWFLGGVAIALVAYTAGRPRVPQAAGGTLTPVQRTVEAGSQIDPGFSPDGGQLVFSRDVGSSLEIFVRPVDGGGALQLTTDGPNLEPAWSPDGRWIAYRNLRRGGVWLVSPTGGEPRQLTDFGTHPAWSPDSATIVFSHPGKPAPGGSEWPAAYDSVLWTVDVESGAPRQLTRATPAAGGHGMPAFSADGEWVVFATANLLNGGGLWRVPARGGELVALVRPEANTHGERVLWHDPHPLSGDAGIVALRLGRDARVVRLGWREGEPMAPLLAPAPEGTAGLAVSRDGRRAAFAVEQPSTSIEEIAVDAPEGAAAPPRVLVAPAVRRVSQARYSPDGRRILLFRQRAGSAPEWLVVDREGREERLVEASQHGEWISPTRVVAVTRRGGIEVDVLTGRQTPRPVAEWMRMALERGRPRHAEVRPDVGAVAFTAMAGNARELMVWDAGATAPRVLTRLGGLVDYPFWSADGRWIGFQLLADAPIGNTLWRIASSGGEPLQIRTGAGPSWGGAFSPDATRAVYAAFRDGQWYLAAAGPDADEILLPAPPESRGYLRWPDWSPDGSRVVYERMRYSGNVWTVDLPAGDAP